MTAQHTCEERQSRGGMRPVRGCPRGLAAQGGGASNASEEEAPCHRAYCGGQEEAKRERTSSSSGISLKRRWEGSPGLWGVRGCLCLSRPPCAGGAGSRGLCLKRALVHGAPVRNSAFSHGNAGVSGGSAYEKATFLMMLVCGVEPSDPRPQPAILQGEQQPGLGPRAPPGSLPVGPSPCRASHRLEAGLWLEQDPGLGPSGLLPRLTSPRERRTRPFSEPQPQVLTTRGTEVGLGLRAFCVGVQARVLSLGWLLVSCQLTGWGRVWGLG